MWQYSWFLTSSESSFPGLFELKLEFGDLSLIIPRLGGCHFVSDLNYTLLHTDKTGLFLEGNKEGLQREAEIENEFCNFQIYFQSSMSFLKSGYMSWTKTLYYINWSICNYLICSQRIRHDSRSRTRWSNWTELNWIKEQWIMLFFFDKVSVSKL